ncbi:rhomboid family intramembrane serine protease GlpG [Pseudoalteromonas piscicida]|uniref:Rhomboid family intramembrane serine protease GlpG n=1 Tax=Pseudoalteromonas piscicida TaxID=43662 RepID=A0AAD0W4I1_PSEO7|nr:rhomboid family intramembrane serine protease GlpG [Pseudoalteromonas piscicida]ASD66010.1 rhomboid family intramembrane serine protease GlpG [Pseudoalteromonas piscicida]AXQ96941.1 rhomboid family intramembrane serine protease GlpG [Pseudoalteromonas piscicida]AXR03289.1 rhomboid family intramembrane serine protease GlpG [Pseudoalteromonas piscicida]
MKLIAHYHNARLAQGAVDYFKTQGIYCVLQSHDGQQVEVWLEHGDEALAMRLWQMFLEHPDAELYQAASWQTGSTQGLFSYQGQNLNLVRRFAGLNWLLQGVFGVSIIIFVAMLFGDANGIFSALRFSLDKPWTWIAPTLIHFSAIHLIFNLSWWLHLGAQISEKLGLWALVCIYFVTGLTSNFMQFLFVDANFGGLSGVVYGLLGFCWVIGHRNPAGTALVSKPVIGFMLLWMLFGFTDMFFINMANWAHLFGLLSGMLVAIFWPINRLLKESS